jgi:MATE family multidrug resistance protein
MKPGLLDSLRRIAPQAWPVFVGQIAVLAFTTVDTMLLARHSALDLAALAVGAACYMTVFVGLMGVVIAVGPMAGQLYGAKKLPEAGDQLHQAIWLALVLTLVGEIFLLWPEPFLALAKTTPDVEQRVRGYLHMLALSLPAALVFAAIRGFNTAVSRPKIVMALQVGGLAAKVPLSALLIQGFALPAGLPAVPSLGATGAALATALVMWGQVTLGWLLLRRDPFYAPFGLQHGGLHAPRWDIIRRQLRLGVPMGLSILIEVTGFTFMAIFIARLGATVVAGHQLAVNLVALMFMLPMALGNATATLVAQSLGARQWSEARRLGRHGMEIGLLASATLAGVIFLLREQVLGLYTHDATIIAAALPLLLWVWIFHTADAVQTVAAAVLRAHHIATMPMVIYALAIWGVGMGGGYHLAYSGAAWVPAELRGAGGFWVAATAGLTISALALWALLAWVHRQEARERS